MWFATKDPLLTSNCFSLTSGGMSAYDYLSAPSEKPINPFLAFDKHIPLV